MSRVGGTVNNIIEGKKEKKKERMDESEKKELIKRWFQR